LYTVASPKPCTTGQFTSWQDVDAALLCLPAAQTLHTVTEVPATALL
jgi:hypothetical protein